MRSGAPHDHRRHHRHGDEPPHRGCAGCTRRVHEELTAFDLPVAGALPGELDGRYLRNGPNPVGAVDPATVPLVHRRRHGPRHPAARRAGRVVPQPLGALDRGERRRSARRPSRGSATAAWTPPTPTSSASPGARYAIVEAGAPPVELSDELDTIGHSDLGGTLPNGYTAHPEGRPGDRLAARHRLPLGAAAPAVRRRSAPTGCVSQVEPIEVDGGPMVHDCSITERWMVVYDLPVTFDLDGAMHGVRFPYRWNEGRPARVGLVPLGGQGSDVRWFDVAPVLRVPSAQRVRRRRPRRARRRPLRAHVRRQPARSRRVDAAAVALDARHRHRPRRRAPAERRAARVPAGRRARRRPPPRHRLGVRRADRSTAATTSAAGSCASTARPGDARSIDLGPRPPRRRVGDGAARRRRRRGRRVADEPRLRPGRGPHRPRRAVGRRPRRPAPWRPCSCPTRVPLGFHGNFVPAV